MNDRRPSVLNAGGVATDTRQPSLTFPPAESSSPIDAQLPARHIIRSATDVYAAAAAIPTTRHPWAGEVGPVWRLTVMPGGIALGSKDYAKIEASSEARIARALREDVTMKVELDVAPKRGRISAWSQKSRANMVKTLCAIDYSAIAGDGCRPVMVTLTMPHDWDTIAATPTLFKKMVNKFRGRYETSWGRPMAGIWKMEFQYRKECAAKGCHDPRAPHLHILTSMPEGTAPRPLTVAERSHMASCKKADCEHSSHIRPDMDFKTWLSHAWALSVGHTDEREFAKHLAAGTNVSEEETLRYADAKRIAVYFTKHGTFANKEYQNDLPDVWADAIESEDEAGARFWGYWVVRPIRGSKEIDPTLIMHIARHLRKTQRAAGYVRTTQVWRLNTRTGEYRKRRVRRRVKYMKGHRGFLSVNDGVAAALDVARIIEMHTRERDWFDMPAAMKPDRGSFDQDGAIASTTLAYIDTMAHQLVPEDRYSARVRPVVEFVGSDSRTDPLPLLGDDVHYSKSGYVTTGETFVDMIGNLHAL